MVKQVAFWSMLLMVVTAATGARAEPPAEADRAALAKLLRIGAEAAQAKRFAACVEAYESAFRIDASAATQGEIGVCEEALGRDVAAFEHLSAALRTPGIERGKEPWKRFGERLSRVTARVAQVFLAVDPPNASVVIDGRPLGKAEGRSIALAPGSHVFSARLDGYQDAVETRLLQAGDLPSIHLFLQRKERAPAGAAPSTSSATAQRPAGSAESATAAPPAAAVPAWYVPSWSPRGVFVGLTYAGAATALVSGATALGLEVDRQSIAVSLAKREGGDACADPANPPPECGPLRERRDQRSTARTVFIGSAVAAGVAAVTAAVLSLAHKEAPAKVAVVPRASSDGGGVALVGIW